MNRSPLLLWADNLTVLHSPTLCQSLGDGIECDHIFGELAILPHKQLGDLDALRSEHTVILALLLHIQSVHHFKFPPK